MNKKKFHYTDINKDYLSSFTLYLLTAMLMITTLAMWLLPEASPTTPDDKNARTLGLGVATLILSVFVLALKFQRLKLSKFTIICLPLTFLLVFRDYSFINALPQGIWIPFFIALSFSSLRTALIVLALSAIIIIFNFPSALNSPSRIIVALMFCVLLFVGHLNLKITLAQANESRKIAESNSLALRESELEYRTLVERSPLAIISFAKNGKALWVNKAWETLWGLPFSALEFYSLYNDRQVKKNELLPLIEKTLSGQSVEFPTIRYCRPMNLKGTHRKRSIWVHTFAYRLLDLAGNPRELILIQEDVTERVKTQKETHLLAYYDPLTHLPNRRLLMDRIGKAQIASERTQELGALLILDLDNFKIINDSKGHPVGDELLRKVANRITSTVRADDTVSRLGGDEYVIILDSLGKNESESANHAASIADKISREIEKPYILNNELTMTHCTTSIGVSFFKGRNKSIDTLIKEADVALYQAKNAGRNTVYFFDKSMQEVIDSRLKLEADLRLGITNNEFELFYQPQVKKDGAIYGVEALLRWRRPNGELITPNTFIPLAEETTLIRPLGKWVINQACAQVKAWQANEATRDLCISVNISAVQFIHQDIVSDIRESLRTYDIPHKLLKLELTESVLLESLDLVIDAMKQLDELGIGFTMDDFGTGYSSLAYLRSLPIKELKIDQSFIQEMMTDSNDAAIIKAILAMSHSLGIRVVAEGVESEAQWDMLNKNGCEFYQGFFFGHPISASAFEEKLHA